MFTHSNDHTTYNNTLYIYGEPGSGKSFILRKIAQLFGIYEDTADSSEFVSSALLNCTGRAFNEVRFDTLLKCFSLATLLRIMEGDAMDLNTKFRGKIRYCKAWPCFMTSQYPPPGIFEDLEQTNLTGVRAYAVVGTEHVLPGQLKAGDIRAINR